MRQFQSWRLATILLIVIVVVARLSMAWFNSGSYFDEYLHIGAAIGELPNYKRGIYIAVIIKLLIYTFGMSLPILKLIPALLGLLNLFIFWIIAKQVVVSKGLVFLSLLLYAFSPWVIINHFYIRFYVFLEFAVLLTLWASLLLASKQVPNCYKILVCSIAIVVNLIYYFYTNDMSRYILLFILSANFLYWIIALLYSRSNFSLVKKIETIFIENNVIIRLIIVAFVFGFALLSILSRQDIISQLLNINLTFPTTIHKFPDFFLKINLVTTMLFAIGFYYALSNLRAPSSLIIFSSVGLFVLHALVGYQFQMVRTVFYFIGPFVLAAVYGLDRLRTESILKAVFVFALLITLFNNYPSSPLTWIKRPDMLDELDYKEYLLAFEEAKKSDLPIYGLTSSARIHGCFYQTQFAQDYIYASIWYPTESLETIVEDFIDSFPNAVLLVDEQGYEWLQEHGYDHILAKIIEPKEFAGDIFVYKPASLSHSSEEVQY